jgi:hypothetical protein
MGKVIRSIEEQKTEIQKGLEDSKADFMEIVLLEIDHKGWTHFYPMIENSLEYA